MSMGTTARETEMKTKKTKEERAMAKLKKAATLIDAAYRLMKDGDFEVMNAISNASAKVCQIVLQIEN